MIPIDNKEIESHIRNDFNYSGTGLPAGLVLKNTAHESVTTSNQILPLGVVYPGSIFALWKNLDTDHSFHPIKMFTITAGARFICMLPNISDLSLHKNLKRDFNVKQPPPKTLFDHWEIFKSIVFHPSSKCTWTTDLLFFSEKWFEKIKSDSAWYKLRLLMLESAWRKSAYERNLMFYNLAFSRAQANRNLKPNPYLADTTKHLMMIAAGTVTGFGVTTDDSNAPISIIQDAYINSYGLKDYIPTMFTPTHFLISSKENSIVYYSLAWPTTLEFSPKSRKETSILRDLAEIRHLIITFMDEIKKNRLKVEDTILGHIASMVEFEFFHSKNDKLGEIKMTSEMVRFDPKLLWPTSQNKCRQFADSGALIRGCIKISNKNAEETN